MGPDYFEFFLQTSSERKGVFQPDVEENMWRLAFRQNTKNLAFGNTLGIDG